MKPTTNQDYTEKKIHNTYDKSTKNKPTNNNFGKIASSKVSAGRKKKKPTTLKTYIRVNSQHKLKMFSNGHKSPPKQSNCYTNFGRNYVKWIPKTQP